MSAASRWLVGMIGIVVFAEAGASAVPGATVTVASNFNPSTLGQTVVFTATVSATSLPTGAVDFFDDVTPLCSAVPLAGGQATCATSALATGTRSITGVYGGNFNWLGATSLPLPQDVGGASATVLTVGKDGSGSGAVISMPPGIDCGADCDEPYAVPTPVTLTAMPDAGSLFAGWSGACTGTGACNVNIAAATSVGAAFAPNAIAPLRIDVEANRAYHALTDGLIILRYLFGLSGNSLVAGALGTGAALTDPALVLARLDDMRPALDVDGNGRSEALTDGLLIIRYLFGLRGDGLLAGALGDGATRIAAPVIEPYIRSLMPLPVPANGAPIAAGEKTWTFVPFSDAMCDDGSTTGLGVSLSSTSNSVLIVLNGGGACWDELTCYTLNTAVHGPFGAGQFTSLIPALDAAWIFKRGEAANPFKDYNYVFVPYCTGDSHAGNKVMQYGTHTHRHVGYANMAAFLDRIVPTFPAADRVVLSGLSSGGTGAVFNWWQTQRRFGGIRVDMIDDSGPFMPPNVVPPGGVAEQARRNNWNLAATLPPLCASCSTSLDTLWSYYATAFPDNRATLLSYDEDAVVRASFGLTAGQFTAGLSEFIANQIAPNPNFRSFVAAGTSHQFLNAGAPTVTSGGVALGTFITQMVTGDPSWASLP